MGENDGVCVIRRRSRALHPRPAVNWPARAREREGAQVSLHYQNTPAY